MSNSIVARRYARALLKLTGSDLAVCDETLASLAGLRALFAIKPAALVLKSPVMPGDLKKSLLTFALNQTKAEDTVRNFVLALVDLRRVSLIPGVVEIYAELVDGLKNQVRAVLTTALDIAETEKSQIRTFLERTLHKTVLLDQRIAPEILGGFRVDVGNSVIDLSLRSGLDSLTQATS